MLMQELCDYSTCTFVFTASIRYNATISLWLHMTACQAHVNKQKPFVPTDLDSAIMAEAWYSSWV